MKCSPPDFLQDVFAVEAGEMIRELEQSPMRVILVPAPEARFDGHKVRAVESRPPEWYMLAYERLGRKTFKRHRFVQALERIRRRDFRLSRYTQIAIEVMETAR